MRLYKFSPEKSVLRQMRLENVWFTHGMACAGKSTLVKNLAEKRHGIACEKNYHRRLSPGLDAKDFPNLI